MGISGLPRLDRKWRSTASPRPRRRRGAEQRDELTSFQLIESHPIPASQGQIVGYRIGENPRTR
jgi:hypothetical protein